jgi:hypothetical protein
MGPHGGATGTETSRACFTVVYCIRHADRRAGAAGRHGNKGAASPKWRLTVVADPPVSARVDGGGSYGNRRSAFRNAIFSAISGGS